MHRTASTTPLHRMLAYAFAVVLVLALPAIAVARPAAAAELLGPQVAAAADVSDPDWCDDTNDDPADDCPATEDPPPPPPPDSDGDGIPDDLDPPDWIEPPALWPPTPNDVVARIAEDGRTAIAPNRAPRLVKDLVHAANRITRKPYKWGGGHARLNDRGYDCSGATSYVLRSVGLMDGSMVSGSFKMWGVNGAGRWVNVYANKGHVFVVIAGLRFDTSGAGESGPRWREEPRGISGFKLRHPAKY